MTGTKVSQLPLKIQWRVRVCSNSSDENISTLKRASRPSDLSLFRKESAQSTAIEVSLSSQRKCADTIQPPRLRWHSDCESFSHPLILTFLIMTFIPILQSRITCCPFLTVYLQNMNVPEGKWRSRQAKLRWLLTIISHYSKRQTSMLNLWRRCLR